MLRRRWRCELTSVTFSFWWYISQPDDVEVSTWFLSFIQRWNDCSLAVHDSSLLFITPQSELEGPVFVTAQLSPRPHQHLTFLSVSTQGFKLKWAVICRHKINFSAAVKERRQVKQLIVMNKMPDHLITARMSHVFFTNHVQQPCTRQNSNKQRCEGLQGKKVLSSCIKTCFQQYYNLL